MNKRRITLGDALTYKWKYIVIDPVAGWPIYLDGKEVGGFLVRVEVWGGGVRTILVEGIEIDPEFRGRGIAGEVVRRLFKISDLILGSITEDEAKPFWEKMGAIFKPLPLSSFPEHTLPTVKSKHPVLFFITNHPEGKKMGEVFAREVPDLMKKLPYLKKQNV